MKTTPQSVPSRWASSPEPDETTRQPLKDAGSNIENGNRYRNQTLLSRARSGKRPGRRGESYSASLRRKMVMSRNLIASGTSEDVTPTTPSWTVSGISSSIGSYDDQWMPSGLAAL